MLSRAQLKRRLQVVVFSLRPPRRGCVVGGWCAPCFAQTEERPRGQVGRRRIGVVDLDGQDVLPCQQLRRPRAIHVPSDHVGDAAVEQHRLQIAVRVVPSISCGAHEVGRALNFLPIEVGDVAVVVVHGPPHLCPILGRFHLKPNPEVQRAVVGDHRRIVSIPVANSPGSGHPAAVVKPQVFPGGVGVGDAHRVAEHVGVNHRELPAASPNRLVFAVGQHHKSLAAAEDQWSKRPPRLVFQVVQELVAVQIHRLGPVVSNLNPISAARAGFRHHQLGRTLQRPHGHARGHTQPHMETEGPTHGLKSRGHVQSRGAPISEGRQQGQ